MAKSKTTLNKITYIFEENNDLGRILEEVIILFYKYNLIKE